MSEHQPSTNNKTAQSGAAFRKEVVAIAVQEATKAVENGDHPCAETLFREAYETVSKDRDDSEEHLETKEEMHLLAVFSIHKTIAKMLFQGGDTEGALCESYKQLPLLEDGMHKELEVSAHRDIAALLKRKGDLEQAKEHYEKALEIIQGIETPEKTEQIERVRKSLARIYNGLGASLTKQGDIEGALCEAYKLLSISEDFADKMMGLSANRNIAILLMEKDDLEQAKEHYEKALEILQSIEISRKAEQIESARMSLARIHGGIAVKLFKQGDIEGTLCAAYKQLSMSEGGADTLTEMSAHVNIGAVLKRKGDLEQAKEHFEKSFEMLQGTEIPERAEEIERSRRSLALIYLETSLMLFKRGDIEGALCDAHKQLCMSEGGTDTKMEMSAHRNIAALLMEKGDPEQAKEHCEKALEILQNMDSDSPDKAEEVETLKRTIGQLEHQIRMSVLDRVLSTILCKVIVMQASQEAAKLLEQGEQACAESLFHQEYERVKGMEQGNPRTAHFFENIEEMRLAVVAEIHDHIAGVCVKRGDKEGALAELHSEVKLLEQHGDRKEAEAFAHKAIGKLLSLEGGDLEQAKEHYETALTLLQGIDTNDKEQKLEKIRSAIADLSKQLSLQEEGKNLSFLYSTGGGVLKGTEGLNLTREETEAIQREGPGFTYAGAGDAKSVILEKIATNIEQADAQRKEAPEICVLCGKPGGKRCTACYSKSGVYEGPLYCSRECQVEHWKTVHKKECRRRKNKRGIEITSIKFYLDGNHLVEDPKTKKLRKLTEKDLDSVVYSGGVGPMGSQGGASAALDVFTLLTVVDLPAKRFEDDSGNYLYDDVSDGMMSLVKSACVGDSLYGSAQAEIWKTNRSGKRVLVKDVVAVVMERFRVKYTKAKARKEGFDEDRFPFLYGINERFGVLGANADTGTYLSLKGHVSSVSKGPVYMMMGGDFSGDGECVVM